MGASSSGSEARQGQNRGGFLEDPNHWSAGLDNDLAPAPPRTRQALRACSSTSPPAAPSSPSSSPVSTSQTLARRPVPPSISTQDKGLGSDRESDEEPAGYRAEEGEEKQEAPAIQPTGGLHHQSSSGMLSHQASGILHHQASGIMHHQTSGMLHHGASGMLHHQTSSIYASERSKASTSWQNPKAALSSAMRFFGLTAGTDSASAQDLAAEVFELALTICMATAPEIMSFVEAFGGEDKKALHRLCSTAKKVGLLGASTPKWSTPAPLSELARAFLTQEGPATRPPGSKDISPASLNHLRSGSSLSLSSAVVAKGGKDLNVKRQVTFDMEEQERNSGGSGREGTKSSLKRGGTGSRSNLGLDRSRSDLGRALNLNRSVSDLSCSSFTDFNKRNKGFNISSPEKMRPSFLDFLTSLEQRPLAGHAGGGIGMGMGMGMDVQESGVQMVMDIAIPGAGGRAPLDTVSEAGVSYHSHFDAVFGSEGEEKETVQAEVLNVSGANGGSPGHMRIAFRSKCLRTQNEWQRQLLTQQRCLLNMVSTKLKAAELTVKAADDLGNEQKELLRGFRKIIVREVAEDEGQHRVSVFIIEKNDSVRSEVEELCRILEYPCQAFMGMGAAQTAVRDDALEVNATASDKSLTQTPSGRNSSGSLLEGRSGWETQDWRSRALTPTSTSSGKHGKGSAGSSSKGFFLNDTSQSVRLVLLGVAWVDKDLPQEWQQEGIYVVLTSQAEEFEDVGRALLASGEAEIRERLRAKGIHEYLLHPLSLEGLRAVVGEAFRRRFSDEYLLLQAVGRGTSGVVHRAKRLPDGGTFALKEINTKRLSRNAKAEVEREGLLLKELRWPTVVFLVDTWENTGDRLRYLLMPLLDGGNLLQRTEAVGKEGGQKASAERIAEWYAQTLHGLTYLHWRGVIHRDLKPGNLLLGADDRSLQIGDLGSAVLLPGPGPHPARANTVKGSVCTPLYAAPETLLNEIFATGTDLWSVGATFYEVLTLNTFLPSGLDIPKLQEEVRQFDFRTGPWPAALSEVKSSLPPMLELPDMMQLDHLLRPTASELVGRSATFRRLRTVLGAVGALPHPDDRKQHFDEFGRVRSESDAAANLDPPEEERAQPEGRQTRQRRHQR